MLRVLQQYELFGVSLPWFHPGAAWIAASRSRTELPTADQMKFLTGAVLRAPQFTASTASDRL
jgi:hypothetical protein